MLASLAPLSRLSLSQLPLSALSAAAAAAAPPVRLRLGTIKPQLNHPGPWVPSRSVTRSRAFPLLVWSERRRADQRFRVDDCYGWPIAHWRVSRSNGTQRWKALGSMLPCFGGRRVLWVLFSSSPSTLS